MEARLKLYENASPGLAKGEIGVFCAKLPVWLNVRVSADALRGKNIRTPTKKRTLVSLRSLHKDVDAELLYVRRGDERRVPGTLTSSPRRRC